MNPLECTDSKLNNIMDQLLAGEAFLNPQSTIINALTTQGGSTHNFLTEDLLRVLADPTSETFAGDVTSLVLAQTQIAELTGGIAPEIIGNVINGQPPIISHTKVIAYNDSIIGRYLAFTDFLSGKGGMTGTIPVSVLGMVQDVPNAAVLGTLTFAGLLGVAAGGLSMDQALCRLPSPPGAGDPPLPPGAKDPCAGVKKLFGAVLGLINGVLDAIGNGLALINKGLAYLTEGLAKLAAAVAELVNKIIGALTSIIDEVMKAIAYGLAGLLKALNKIPCFKDVFEAIGSPGLAQGLSILT